MKLTFDIPEELKEALDNAKKENAFNYMRVYNDTIYNAIKNGTPQQKTGHWIDADCDNAICSCCSRLNHLYGTYCKHCGAKMVEPQEGDKGCMN